MSKCFLPSSHPQPATENYHLKTAEYTNILSSVIQKHTECQIDTEINLFFFLFLSALELRMQIKKFWCM